jgi:hypothetical protein
VVRHMADRVKHVGTRRAVTVIIADDFTGRV